MVVDAATLKGILPIEIDRPAEAGADRLCNALAAGIEVGGPAIVIDLGTSTNFDVIDANGAYLGGAIAPGLGALAGGAGRRGPASCHGSSCGGPSMPSAPTPSTPCSPARCLGTSAWCPAS